MKKKILALVLCLVFCVPFILTSCFGGGDFNETISSFRKDYNASYDSYDYETFYGEVVSKSGRFFFTKETETEPLMEYAWVDSQSGSQYQQVGTKTSYTYRVYDALKAEVLYSATATYCDYDYYRSDEWTTNLTSVSIAEWGEDLFMIMESYDSYSFSSSYTYKLYDETGYCQLSSSELTLDWDILDNLDKEAVIFDDSLYIYDTETNSLSKVKTFSENSVRSFVKDLYQVGDKYVLKTDSDVYVFDSSFKQLYGTNYSKFSTEPFKVTSTKSFVLDNGNILVQFVCELGAYSDLYDTAYDYCADGTCYNVNTYIYTVDNGSYDEINCDYIISSVSNSKDAIESGYIALPGEADNIASVQAIDDGALVYVDNNSSVKATLSNDGDIKIISHEDLGDNAYAITDERYIVRGEYYTRLYDKNNNVIGEVGSVVAFNKNFIVTNEAIYDLNLNSVVSLDEDTVYYSKTNDTIVYKEVGSSSTSYYLVEVDEYGWTTTNHITTNDHYNSTGYGSYYTTASIYVFDRFYFTVETDYSYNYSSYLPYVTNREITFYETDGTIITSYTLPTESSSDSCYTYSVLDDSVIFAVKTNSKNYFVTLETMPVEQAK
ncbi:MAG: hypothetical protein IJ437_05855 [Clostridia bacterium]|nr:hypothetical protein [Clostridia bacterium]